MLCLVFYSFGTRTELSRVQQPDALQCYLSANLLPLCQIELALAAPITAYSASIWTGPAKATALVWAFPKPANMLPICQPELWRLQTLFSLCTQVQPSGLDWRRQQLWCGPAKRQQECARLGLQAQAAGQPDAQAKAKTDPPGHADLSTHAPHQARAGGSIMWPLWSLSGGCGRCAGGGVVSWWLRPRDHSSHSCRCGGRKE